MIIIGNLNWDNWFSYGSNNNLKLDEYKLLQVMGINGVGKTSIPLILEEVLYGKNSKGIKKSSLLNRHLPTKALNAELDFIVGSDEYKIILSRKSTLKLKLLKNSIDISSHTATATYKSIQSILGMDFKTFSQLIYQSSKSNLDFLTSTDVNRKKFLISLFNLEKYVDIHNQFKSVYTDINNSLSTINGKLLIINSWVDKHKDYDFTESGLYEIPKLDSHLIDELTKYKYDLSSISTKNADINKNNQYKELLSLVDRDIMTYTEEVDKEFKDKLALDLGILRKSNIEINTKVKLENNALKKYSNLGTKCHTCDQNINTLVISKITSEISSNIDSLNSQLKTNNSTILDINNKLASIKVIEDNIRLKNKNQEEFLKLTSLINYDLPSNVLDQQDLSNTIFDLTTRLDTLQRRIQDISAKNNKIEAANSKLQVIQDQLNEYLSTKNELDIELKNISELLDKVSLIKKAFSPTGLINYKIEYLVKDLEKEINNYLGELSSGRFQILFVLEGEKLNIRIVDNGIEISIEELSAGELARINASTLLAIRKLMSALSSTKINILFLDEVMGVLDAEGKEKLIDVLNDEKNLNTLLVSHEFSHPLIEKMTIVKEDNISRIET